MTTGYMPRVTSLDDADLDAPDVVLVHDFSFGAPLQCEWCGALGAFTSVRVAGREVCRRCGPDLVQREREERPVDSLIEVEVAVR